MYRTKELKSKMEVSRNLAEAIFEEVDTMEIPYGFGEKCFEGKTEIEVEFEGSLYIVELWVESYLYEEKDTNYREDQKCYEILNISKED